jgi:serine/threonine protein kinase
MVEIDLFKDDPKQTDKTKELYELIKKIMEPEPAKRPSAHELLKSIVFEVTEAVPAPAA